MWNQIPYPLSPRLWKTKENFLEILENLEILEILEIPPVKRPLS